MFVTFHEICDCLGYCFISFSPNVLKKNQGKKIKMLTSHDIYSLRQLAVKETEIRIVGKATSSFKKNSHIIGPALAFRNDLGVETFKLGMN